MKKLLTTFVFCALLFSMSQAQNSDKIKGNRLVSIINTEINSFHTIELDDDFQVDLIYNKIPSIEIETDENLHECIEFNVRDSILHFNKTKKITSKKKLVIKVMYDDFFKHIRTTDKAELNGLVPIYLKDGTLKTSGTSQVALTIKAERFDFEGTNKSKVKLNLTTADTCSIAMLGSSKIEALINAPIVIGTLKDRTHTILEGDCNTANLTLDNNSQFQGKNFTVNTCHIVSNSTDDAYLEVVKDITIDISGTSAIYLYENPKITINKMTGTSKLEKKIK